MIKYPVTTMKDDVWNLLLSNYVYILWHGGSYEEVS